MKRKLKISFQITVVVLILLILAFLLTGVAILFRGFGQKAPFTYMIVLGTVVEGTEPSPMLHDRIEATAKYMQENPEVIAIVTGGKADEVNLSEAQCMYNELTELGISPDRILMEDRAASTAENFRYSMELLEEELGRVPRNIGVLSSEFHLLRARLIAKSYDLDVATIPAHTSDTQAFFKYYIREIFMVWYDGLKLLFT